MKISVICVKKTNYLYCMRNTLILFGLLFLIHSCEKKYPQIEIKTELGTILVEVYPDKAPVTANNFIHLVKENKLDGAVFYRVVGLDNQTANPVKIGVIQGGLYDKGAEEIPVIQHETTKQTGILHKDGVISMARMQPGTASSEFFICINDQPELDFGGKRNPDGQGFAAFGKVILGMDIVRKIQQLPDDSQSLVDPVKITGIKVLD